MTQNLILGAGILTWILLIVVVVLVLKKERFVSSSPSCGCSCENNCQGDPDPSRCVKDCCYSCKCKGPDCGMTAGFIDI